jgi:hypothetical protein
VWKAPATGRGRTRAPAGGSAASFSSASSAPAATIWPAPFRLAGVSPTASQQGGHAGGGQRARRGHLGTAAGREGDRGGGGQCAGDGRRGELADAVAGDDALTGGLEVQLPGDDHPERDEQRLGDGRVLDLLGVGGGAEPDEIETGRLGQFGDLLGHTGQIQPGREHAGRLSALTWSEYGDHSTNHSLPTAAPASTTHTGFGGGVL